MATILLAYSNEAKGKILAWILQSERYNCVVVTDCDQARNRFWQKGTDLVILDDDIAGHGGICLAESLKQIRNVPILMYAERSPRGRIRYLDSVMLWPQSAGVLFRMVEHLLASPPAKSRVSRTSTETQITLTQAISLTETEIVLKKDKTRLPSFVRKRNDCSGSDSICSDCYLMIGSGDDAKLTKLERVHRCSEQVFSNE